MPFTKKTNQKKVIQNVEANVPTTSKGTSSSNGKKKLFYKFEGENVNQKTFFKNFRPISIAEIDP